MQPSTLSVLTMRALLQSEASDCCQWQVRDVKLYQLTTPLGAEQVEFQLHTDLERHVVLTLQLVELLLQTGPWAGCKWCACVHSKHHRYHMQQVQCLESPAFPTRSKAAPSCCTQRATAMA